VKPVPRTLPANTTGISTFFGVEQRPLQYRFWSSGTVSNLVIVYVHGIEGHGLWFDRAAAQLSQRGINIYAADRAGAGLNKKSFVTSKILLSDLDAFLSNIRSQHPDSDIYLLGNCWGGTLSILYAVQNLPSAVTGLILSCPAIKTLCDVDWLTKLSIGWSYLCNSKKEFPFPLTPEMFTENPDYLEFINNDKLRTTHANARFLIETVTMQYLARQASSKLDLPVLMLQAGRDAIVDSKAVTKWFEQLKNPSNKYHFFETASHSLDFEPDISGFIDAIIKWIEEKELGSNRQH
jgi:alpha-beta hydrolase superfamily lysophospholipase